MSTIGDQLVQILGQAGVSRIFGLVGDSLNPLVDAVRRAEGIEWIHVRNEEAAAFAAGAEAQLTGRLAVCAGSCGPGNTHLIQGLYDAHRSGAPVLAIASHIPTEQIGTSFFQETHPDYAAIAAAAGIHTVRVEQPADIQTALREAFGQPGRRWLMSSLTRTHSRFHPTSPFHR